MCPATRRGGCGVKGHGREDHWHNRCSAAVWSPLRPRVAAATERLGQLRAVVGDDELLVTTEAAAERVRGYRGAGERTEAELASIEPAAVAAELDEAQRWAAELARRQDDLEHAW